MSPRTYRKITPPVTAYHWNGTTTDLNSIVKWLGVNNVSERNGGVLMVRKNSDFPWTSVKLSEWIMDDHNDTKSVFFMPESQFERLYREVA